VSLRLGLRGRNGSWKGGRLDCNGFSLIELLIVSALVSLVTGLGVGLSRVYHHAVSERFSAQVVQFLQYGRSAAMARDTDVLCSIEGRVLVLRSTDAVIDRMLIPAAVSVSMNRLNLGFTEDGHSFRSGSIVLRSGRFDRRVSLGVGYGRISLY